LPLRSTGASAIAFRVWVGRRVEILRFGGFVEFEGNYTEFLFYFFGTRTRAFGLGSRSGHGVFARHALGRFHALGDWFVRAAGVASFFVLVLKLVGSGTRLRKRGAAVDQC